MAVTLYSFAMTSPTADQIATLGTALDTFARRFKLTDVNATDRPLNEVDIQTLRYVSEHPECGPTDVARFLGLATTTISSATDRLAKRGLLERRRTEGDRRAVMLRLSTEGKAWVAAQMEAYNGMFRLMLERLDPAERDEFIRMITKIVYNDP